MDEVTGYILLTRTARDDPKSNGRAEVTVKSVKNQLRRILLQAEVGFVVAVGT